ncbi:hypothetical protein [Streptomyces sp. NPDC092307]|uniref:hypothetical protein n=1 Tax=Streptomyces sp. NPDC092307 TaxID=3366013 RepID=UPI00382620EF
MNQLLRIEIEQVDEDADSLERGVNALREDLLGLDVNGVERVAGAPAPANTRSAALEVANVLAVTLPVAMPLLERVARVVGDWRDRSEPSHTVVVEIGGDRLVLKGVDPTERQRLIADWLAACAATSAREAGH